MKKMHYIFLNTKRVEDEAGVSKTESIIGWKTNEELTVLSQFRASVDLNDYKQSFIETMRQFEEWVENPYERKFITYSQSELKAFSEEIKVSGYKSKTRDFYKIMSYQYWNIENEMTYRMGLNREDVTFTDMLAIYGLTYVGSLHEPNDKLFNTYSLVTHYKTDAKRNKELIVRNGSQENKGYETLNLQPIRATGEEMLRQKMEEGWNVSIECKAKGRGYGMTYEASAYHMDSAIGNLLHTTRHGVGKTLESLMLNLFGAEGFKMYDKVQNEQMEDMNNLLMR